MNKSLLLLAAWGLSFLFPLGVSAQNVGINDDNSTPDANAMLDVKSTSKGVLFPRLTTAQRTTLGTANPTEGMLVFDTDVEAFFYFINGDWVQLATGDGSGVPVGTIMAYGDDTPPAGYLACDGSSVNNATYPALYAAIGTNWGGDGTPNFRLPDLRGRFPRGWDNGAGVDPNAGARKDIIGNTIGDVVGSYQNDDFKSHSHSHRSSTYGAVAQGGNSAGVLYDNNIFEQTNMTGGSESRPENASVLYIIKY